MSLGQNDDGNGQHGRQRRTLMAVEQEVAKTRALLPSAEALAHARAVKQGRKYAAAHEVKLRSEASRISERLPSEEALEQARVVKLASNSDPLAVKRKENARFHQARSYVQALNLQSRKEYQDWCKSGKRPASIPWNPDCAFKGKGWRGWADWLGYKGKQSKKFADFEEARKYVHTLEISSRKPWNEWCKSGERPEYIPSRPDTVYKDLGWRGWPDWLGKKHSAFDDARSYVQALNLRSWKEYSEWSKSGNRPRFIPSNPQRTFKGKGWIGWTDWLGHHERFLNFEEAREYARTLELSSVQAWREWCKGGDRPEGIPADPSKVYRDRGWCSWSDWMGFEFRKADKRVLSFTEARDHARALALGSEEEWRELQKRGGCPPGLPESPDKVYAGKGWIGWQDWLGYVPSTNTESLFLDDGTLNPAYTR